MDRQEKSKNFSHFGLAVWLKKSAGQFDPPPEQKGLKKFVGIHLLPLFNFFIHELFFVSIQKTEHWET